MGGDGTTYTFHISTTRWSCSVPRWTRYPCPPRRARTMTPGRGQQATEHPESAHGVPAPRLPRPAAASPASAASLAPRPGPRFPLVRGVPGDRRRATGPPALLLDVGHGHALRRQAVVPTPERMRIGGSARPAPLFGAFARAGEHRPAPGQQDERQGWPSQPPRPAAVAGMYHPPPVCRPALLHSVWPYKQDQFSHRPPSSLTQAAGGVPAADRLRRSRPHLAGLRSRCLALPLCAGPGGHRWAFTWFSDRSKEGDQSDADR